MQSVLIGFIGIILLVAACTFEKADMIEECLLESLTATSVTKSSCSEATGSIEVEAMVKETFEGTIFYSLNGSTETTDPIFNGLSAGNYEITARTDDECIKNLSVVIENEGGLNIAAEVTDSDCGVATGKIGITPSGQTGTVTYNLNGSGFQTDANFENLEPGDYTLIAKDDTGCEVAQTLKVFSVVQAADVQEIVNSNCAVPDCHGGGISPNLTSIGNIENSADRIKTRTGAGTMPPEGSGFSLTAIHKKHFSVLNNFCSPFSFRLFRRIRFK